MFGVFQRLCHQKCTRLQLWRGSKVAVFGAQMHKGLKNPKTEATYSLTPIYFRRNISSLGKRPRTFLNVHRRKGILLPLFFGSVVAFNHWISQSEDLILSFDDVGLPIEYDIQSINKFWDERHRVVLWRLKLIVSKLVPFCLRTWFTYKVGVSDEKAQDIAAELRTILTELGPAFIKLGQMLSTRPDLLPQSVLFELQKLCDAVPPFPTDKAIEIFVEELGLDALDEFENFDEKTEPIAAASLGQVFKLRLTRSDKYVAVKIQRPDMIRAVSLDLYLLRRYAQFVEAIKSSLMFIKQFDVELVDCFAKGSYAELDYCNEANNQEMFIHELVPRLNNRIRVPRVYRKFTSRKVLTTEWIDGEQLARSSPEVIRKLVPVGVECFLEQLLSWGVFHCDPHAGNLLVDEQQRLVLLDFGLCAEVPRPDTRSMTDAVVHLMEGDVEGLLDDAIKLSFLPKDVDKSKLVVELEKIFKESKIQLVQELGDYKAIERRRKKFHDVSKDLNSVFYRYPFLVPDYFALITRALIVLEGIAVKGNPSFDIFKAAYPYAFQHSISTLGAKDTLALGKSLAQHSRPEAQSWSWKGWFAKIL